MFPAGRQPEHDELIEITWDEVLEEFEECNLALSYAPNSMFNKS
jgi:hypothetical protein